MPKKCSKRLTHPYKKIHLPDKKFCLGLRFGQFLVNAMKEATGNDSDIATHLFYLENDNLQRVIESYFNKYNK